MSLFDGLGGIMKGLVGEVSAAEGPGLVTSALGQFGGLQSIVSTLQQGGLGAEVQSWLGGGSNLPISGDQIRSALGDQQVQALAQHFGLPIDGVLNLLATHLPTAVDQASPNGTVAPPTP